jgi:hypothetical protein
MPWWAWVLIGVAVLALIALAAWSGYRRRHSERLRQAFGPEYDRVVRTTGDQRGGESELESRQKRREHLDIRPLSAAARTRYAEAWRVAQARFVDSPPDAVGEADRLVIMVMRERGYPIEDFETRAGDISVDHPGVVENYRAAHGISRANERGEAETEDLRQAMVHYRTLFEELLGVPGDQGPAYRTEEAQPDEGWRETGT